MNILNNIKIKAIIRGDEIIPSISAASIIAKVARDKHIKKLSKKIHPLLKTRGVPGTHDIKFIINYLKKIVKDEKNI